MTELDAERKKERKEKARELNEQIQIDIWISPKF
jgi:hypothetical protein